MFSVVLCLWYDIRTMENIDLKDEQLVLIIREGDGELYSHIIKRYRSKLSRYLGRFISDPDELEDVLQDVFIKAYRNLYGFDVKRKFSSWIYRIAHNEAVNHIKKNSKVRVSLDDIEYKIVDEKIDLGSKIDKKILRKNIAESLENIGFKYREVLTLFFFEDKSYEEISDILRIPVNTVGTLILRGKKLLKKQLIGQNYGEQ